MLLNKINTPCFWGAAPARSPSCFWIQYLGLPHPLYPLLILISPSENPGSAPDYIYIYIYAKNYACKIGLGLQW